MDAVIISRLISGLPVGPDTTVRYRYRTFESNSPASRIHNSAIHLLRATRYLTISTNMNTL